MTVGQWQEAGNAIEVSLQQMKLLAKVQRLRKPFPHTHTQAHAHIRTMYLRVFHMANAFLAVHFNGTATVQISVIVAYVPCKAEHSMGYINS